MVGVNCSLCTEGNRTLVSALRSPPFMPGLAPKTGTAGTLLRFSAARRSDAQRNQPQKAGQEWEA
jgi:hypothetical protein